MQFSATLALFFSGLAVASPLLAREPQRFVPGLLDPDFAPPSPVDNGPKNSQGLSQEACDTLRKNHNADTVANLGCNEFN